MHVFEGCKFPSGVSWSPCPGASQAAPSNTPHHKTTSSQKQLQLYTLSFQNTDLCHLPLPATATSSLLSSPCAAVPAASPG